MIALIAHDGKKEQLIKFVRENRDYFLSRKLVATNSTGQRLKEQGFQVECVPHGPHGGDIIIAAMVAQDKVKAVFFFRDLLSCQPHEPDVTSLLRMCDIYDVPLALNLSTARALIAGM